ncbi:MAG: hypothetical protein SPK53_08070 [Selenomonas sp.]|nr:hypothetical protein [Selenomonadales bacterium]MDD7764057.1 hypothetical protein [Selenomonadales bacterium]MDY5717680.1 hypothetical protein [Selenomonas sp.]
MKLCPPAPTGPTPSTVGIPIAAVILPSEPPPVATQPNDKPCFLPIEDASGWMN